MNKKTIFKKTALAILISASFQSIAIGETVNPLLEERVNFTGTPSQNLNEIQWTVIGVPEGVNFSHENMAGNPRDIAINAITEIRRSGFLDRYIFVDQNNGIIEIKKADSQLDGELVKFLPKEIEGNAISKRLPLIRKAAESYNGTPDIKIGQIENGILPVSANVKEKDKRYQKGVTLSSFGSRYSGTDTVSLFAYGSPFDGYILKSSYSYGLSDFRSSSDGGKYHGLSLNLEKPEPFGVLGANYLYSNSKQGGVFLPLDMNQYVHVVDLYLSYPMINNNYQVGIKHVDQSMEMNAINLESKQRYQSLVFSHDMRKGFNTSNPNFVSNLKIDHNLSFGINGNTDGILYGVGAKDNWVKYEIELNHEQRIHDFQLSTHIGMQLSDTEFLPNHEKFYLGGPRRGSSYYAGVASVEQGMYFSTRLYSQTIDLYEKDNNSLTLRPFIGYNQSYGKSNTLGTLEARSIELGTKINFGNQFIGELGLSHRVNDDFNPDDDSRLMFNISYLF